MTRKYTFRLSDKDYARYDIMNEHEDQLLAKGYQFIAGVDEAGRGPLAGPVSVAACILDPAKPIYGLNDSKKLTEKRREHLFEVIKANCLAYQMVLIPVEEIENSNILTATKKGMAKAILGLDPKPEIALIDAVRLDNPKFIDKLPAQRSLVQGDAISNSIAAASVLAKVSRDQYMREQAKFYPEYQFENHKGYATKAHYEAINKFGVTPIHRLSFLHKLKLGAEKQTSNKATGHQAEQIVTNDLERKGYQILEQNFWLSSFGEIDIIMKKGNRLIFVEVKARQNYDFEDLGIAALDQKKQWKIKRLAEYYFSSRKIDADEIIFLLATARLNDEGQVDKIKYYDF
ncbi:MAG: ribonuclease HII [Clostridiaceae bacterium]|nr:ribonuclease HII [Clostridiaceae bacterium]